MKIVFTTSGQDLNGPMDSRFGRAAAFLIYDLEQASFEVIDNQENVNAAHGAGIQSAQNVINQGAEILVTGHCGPKAFRVLAAAGVKIYMSTAATVELALADYNAGELKEQTSE
jgi:predicted Fe-Mo cluster-binding NifX family protein